MRILKKIGKWLLIFLGAIIGILLILLLIIRINSSGKEEPFVDENGNVLANSIAMHENMIINGVPQRITIRGKDKNNPVLLIVHGGPGAPILPVIYKLTGVGLEDLFTVCYWDQRGSGLAYNDSIPDSSITLSNIVDDGLQLSKHLKETFKKDKIYIEGLSWGTAVAAYMVQKNPELYHAYIGTGLMANQSLSEELSYDFAMSEAEKYNDTLSITQLKQIGRPPYSNNVDNTVTEAFEIERSIVLKYAPFKLDTDFTFFKDMFMDNGLTFKEKFTDMLNSPESYYPASKILESTAIDINLMRDIPEFKVPVYIFQGDNDHFTVTSVAKAYFDSIVAPSKKWFLFENGTHGVQLEYPEKYRSLYINEILKKNNGNKRENPEILNLSFEKDLIPEGFTVDGKSKKIFLNSLKKNTIVTSSIDGSSAKTFLQSSEYGYLPGFGMTIKGDTLYALGNSLAEKENQSILLLLQLTTGDLIDSYSLNDTEVHYWNDLAVSANNTIFITDSQSNKVYKIDRPSNDIEVFINSEEIPNCNGITISDDNQYLYLASDRGIGVVDISSKKILNAPQDQFSSIDGLKFHQNNLYGIVNGWGDSTLNGLFKFNLNDNLTEVVSNDRLVEFTEEFIIPTTFDIFDGHIYFIINTQLGNLDTNKNEIIDLSTLESYKMLKINME